MENGLLTLMIKTNSGVPYLVGEPGTGKTSILCDIAKENNWKVVFFRLSQIDEAEIAGIPNVDEDKQFFAYALSPKIKDALDMNGYDGTLLLFDEFNRGQLPQRNAAMEFFCERTVGGKLKLPDNVYLAATGNLGSDDGTDVEDIENAQNNRLIRIEHNLSFKQWYDDFAKNNVNKYITDFLSVTESVFTKIDLDKPCFPTPRSWTNFSNFLNLAIKGKTLPKIIEIISKTAHCYVGEAAAIKFVNFLNDYNEINVNDIINNFDNVVEQVKKQNRSQISSLLNEIENKKLGDYTSEQLKNITKFFDYCEDDLLVGVLKKWVINLDVDSNTFEIERHFLGKFKKLLTHISDVM